MGKWYVIASRPTSFEEGAYNAVEIYTYNSKKDEIDIDFTYNKNSLSGEKKSVPQKGYVIDKINNSYWKVSPFWPLKFDYLIIGLDKNYEWCVIGVPDEKFIWIMARTPVVQDDVYNKILGNIKDLNYNIENIKRVINSN